MDQTQDAQHLRLLSIFHYVLAAIAALFSLIPVIHLVLGIAIVSGMLAGEVQDGRDMPPAMGWFFIIPAILIITIGETLAVCIAIAGKKLGSHTGYNYCMAVALMQD